MFGLFNAWAQVLYFLVPYEVRDNLVFADLDLDQQTFLPNFQASAVKMRYYLLLSMYIDPIRNTLTSSLKELNGATC